MSVLRSQQLDGLLKGTSRSFYLTLRVLPGRIRNQIGLAYLLARTTDTIADTELVPLDQRLKALQALRGRILGSGQTDPDLGELSQRQTLPAEQALLKRVSETLAMLDFLGADDLKLIREVLQTISSGQELDLRRFAGVLLSTSSPSKPRRSWMTTLTASLGVLANFGPKCAALIFSAPCLWMTAFSWLTGSALVKGCSSLISFATCRLIFRTAVAIYLPRLSWVLDSILPTC